MSLRSVSGITKCGRLLLQSVLGLSKCDRQNFLQYKSGVTTCDSY